jgi:arsenate reductase
MSMTVYGIPNCDTVKKARVWLDAHEIAYRFHDYRKDGVPEAALRGWVERLGWEALLNRKGTTFRKLPDEARADLDAEKATALMIAHPSAIRRPVVERGDEVYVGFASEQWAAAFG